jgi:hypothetical protein
MRIPFAQIPEAGRFAAGSPRLANGGDRQSPSSSAWRALKMASENVGYG